MFDKLVDTLLRFVELFQFWFVCRAYEQGVVLRFGKFHRTCLPGFHWKFPFRIEVDILVNVVFETISVGPQSLTTLDDIPVVISLIVTMRIEDVVKFLLFTEGAHQVVEDSTYGIASRLVLSKTWQQLREMDIENELTKKSRAKMKNMGAEVISVQIGDFTKSRSLRLISPLGHKSRGVA